MDKQTTLGFILIGLVLIVWMWAQAPSPHPERVSPRDSTTVVQEDTSRPLPIPDTPSPKKTPEVQSQAPEDSSGGKYFTRKMEGKEKEISIETDLYTARISTKGALIKQWELQGYKTWNQYPVHLVSSGQGGNFSLLFTSSDGKLINTRDLYFDGDFNDRKAVRLTGDEGYMLTLALSLDNHRRILKKLTFKNGSYDFDAVFVFENMGEVISNFEYQVVWDKGIPYAERNSIDESSFAMAYAYSGGELIDIDASKEAEVVKKDINGSTNWMAIRNKYFAVAVFPDSGATQGAYLEGVRKPLPDHGELEIYSMALKMPFHGGNSESARFKVFMGPLEFDIVKSYDRGLDEIMSLGAWIIRPISEYLMLPLFEFLHWFIPNYGFVIIVFSIIIKVVLYPLTKTSMKSMKRMQALQPMMTEIREKYKDDPQKMNQSIMNLYKEYGVNPAGGCLPLLLQMPILYALYSVFRSSIQLRQADFIWWITDLSVPDTVIHLPFKIPLFGISELSGLALLMGITMFLQQKMTVTDPRQKAMVWMMPILMTLLFNSFPSGLNLYYFVFNVLSIAQQMWINKQHADEPLHKVDPKKRSGGIMARLTKDLPKLK